MSTKSIPHLPFVLAVLFASACDFYNSPDPERVDCLQRCARAKDTCIVEAHDAASLQRCDGNSEECGARCPS